MNTVYSNFKFDKLPDNEQVYLSLLEGAISSADHLSECHIAKYSDKFSVRVSLSERGVVNSLVEQLNTLNNLMGIRCDYGKSIKRGNIYFTIPLS